MIKGVSRFAALSAVILATGVLPATEEVLYWMVDDNATINDHGTIYSVKDLLPVASDDSDSWSAARIRVTGGDITGDVFLDVYDSDGTLQSGSGALGIAFGETGGYWGAGVPTGNQSPVGNYSAGTPEYSFIIELGNVSWDGTTASWVETVAVSQSATYSDISRFIQTSFDPNPTAGAAWAPTTYNVPEPSSGLLLLVGGGLLLLRRRRAGVT